MTTASDIELHSMVGNCATTTTTCQTLNTDRSGDTGIPNDNDDDDNMTIIFLEPESGIPHDNIDGSNNNNNLPNWIDRLDGSTGDAVFEERRRTIILHELKRIQRRSFINFVILCSLPLLLFTMMIIVIFTSNGDESCPSTITNCRLEARTFANAFTTRCLCDPIPVERNTTTAGWKWWTPTRASQSRGPLCPLPLQSTHSFMSCMFVHIYIYIYQSDTS